MLLCVQLVAGNIYETIPCVWRGAKRRSERDPIVVKGIKIPSWILRLGYQFRWFALGMLATLMLTQLLKITGGRLRPHFLAVCNPDFADINCMMQVVFQPTSPATSAMNQRPLQF